jgi:hypothetical protein
MSKSTTIDREHKILTLSAGDWSMQEIEELLGATTGYTIEGDNITIIGNRRPSTTVFAVSPYTDLLARHDEVQRAIFRDVLEDK